MSTELAGFWHTLNEVAEQITSYLRVWQPTAATMAVKPMGSGGNAWASQCGKKIEHPIGSHDGLLWHTVFFHSMASSWCSTGIRGGIDPVGCPNGWKKHTLRSESISKDMG